MAIGEHYEFATTEEGVRVGRARPSGAALSNCGIVDLGVQTLVFDTGLSPRAGAEIRAEARDATRRAPGLVANSHWHFDHLLGNQAFDDAALYASRGTIAFLAEHRAELEEALRPPALAAAVAELTTRLAQAREPREKSRWTVELGMVGTMHADALHVRLAPPTNGFDELLRLPGDRPAELRTFGSGHTVSDSILFLPESRTIFAGDLVLAGQHPSMESSDPEHWIEVLDRLEELRPDRIVPGHGPVSGPEVVDEMRAYLTAILPLASTTGSVEIPARFRSWAWPGQFDSNLEFLRQRAAANAAA